MLGKNIKAQRESLGKGLNELAREAGVNPGYLSEIERGVKNNPSIETLEKIAMALRVSVSDLFEQDNQYQGSNDSKRENIDELGPKKDIITNEESVPNQTVPHLSQLISYDNMVRIPILGVIRAGDPIFAEENIIGYDYIEKEKAAAETIYELKVDGNSMNLAGIHNGDFVIVKETPEVYNGEIAVVLINGEDATVKRFYISESAVTLTPNSDDSSYKPIVINPKEVDVKVLGKVIGVKRFF